MSQKCDPYVQIKLYVLNSSITQCCREKEEITKIILLTSDSVFDDFPNTFSFVLSITKYSFLRKF